MDNTTNHAVDGSRFVATLIAAAWLSVALGVGIQIAVLTTRSMVGSMPAMAQIISGAAGGISWSVIVCCALAAGSSASRQVDRRMGVLGFVSAPVGWATAKGIQRAIQSVSGAAVDVVTTVMIQAGGVKAVEYGLLGYVLSRLSSRPRVAMLPFAIRGVGFGVLFGSIIVWLEYHAAGNNIQWQRAIAIGINELMFPVGCSTIVYVTTYLRHLLQAPGVDAGLPSPQMR